MKHIGAVIVMAILLAGIARADWVTATVPTGRGPEAMAINPVTNRIYVANYNDNTVTVIDGATNTTDTVPVGANPCAVAVNPVTNKIYVANIASNNVTVIDGVTNGTTNVPARIQPFGVAVNPVTNRIYVTNGGVPGGVTIVNGLTNETTGVGTKGVSWAVAVNPVTNKIYVTNYADSSVTVINGATNETATVVTGRKPRSIAVNPVTNKIYVANFQDASVSVIDGATNGTATVITGHLAWALAVNSVTNKIYMVRAEGSNSVTVIDGATNGTTSVPAGTNPWAVAVNPVTNKIYVANEHSRDVTIIDGATNETSLVAVGDTSRAIAVNPVTNKIYVANYASNSVTVISGATNSIDTIPVGIDPSLGAINVVTNRIYVPYLDSFVAVIDGFQDRVVATVPVGQEPWGMTANPITNKMYVDNFNSGSVTVIYGATNNTVTVPVGINPRAIGVNLITGKVYVGNRFGNTVRVIDGMGDTVRKVITIGNQPACIAVNEATNRLYVPNLASNTVSVIDGNEDTVIASVAVGVTPRSAIVNSAMNKVYVSNVGSGTVSVIAGSSNQVIKTIALGGSPAGGALNSVMNRVYISNPSTNAVAVIDCGTDAVLTTVPVVGGTNNVQINLVTNQLYAWSYDRDTVTVLDCATNATTTIAVGDRPQWLAVNPVTDRIYVSCTGSDIVMAIKDASWIDTRVRAELAPLLGNVTDEARPVITGKAVNRALPYRNKITGVGNRLNTGQRQWRWGTIIGGAGSDSVTWSWNWGSERLIPGENLLCVQPLESDAATTNSLGLGTPFAGNLLVYPVYRMSVLDVGVTGIDAPTGSVDSSLPIIPVAKVKNFGNLVTTLKTFFKISNWAGTAIYSDSQTVTGLKPDSSAVVTFAQWPQPHAPGDYTVRCSAYIADDDNLANDVLGGLFTITCSGWVPRANVPAGPGNKMVKDGGCLTCTQSEVKNRNDPREWGRYQFSGRKPVASPSDTSYVYSLKGNNTCRFYRYNRLSHAWETKESIPAIGRSGRRKAVRKGGCITEAGGKVYAAKGNNSLEFWQYSPGTGGGSNDGHCRWQNVDGRTQSDEILRSAQNDRGGACPARATGRVATRSVAEPQRGEGSRPSALSGWTQLADIPIDASRKKKVGDGAGVAGAPLGETTYVYFLKATGTREFYRYNTVTNSWNTMSPAPLDSSGKPFKKGSCITYDGAGTIYALKGPYNEFFAYDVARDSWARRASLPLVGRSGRKKKAGPGAGIAYAPATDGSDEILRCAQNDRELREAEVYALKGNNSGEFWRYLCDADAWIQLPDVLSEDGKGVKAGGAIAYAPEIPGRGPEELVIIKGGNTGYFYSRPRTGAFLSYLKMGTPPVFGAKTGSVPVFTLLVAPNLFTGTTIVSYFLPEACEVRLCLYDVTGALARTLVHGYQNAGGHSISVSKLDTRNPKLSAGIQLLKLEAYDRSNSARSYTATRKLVVR